MPQENEHIPLKKSFLPPKRRIAVLNQRAEDVDCSAGHASKNRSWIYVAVIGAAFSVGLFFFGPYTASRVSLIIKTQPTAIYIMGDSLSDTGNYPSIVGPLCPPAQWNNHFSNGPMWPEYFSALLGIPYSQSNNVAVGGARTFRYVLSPEITIPGLIDQISELPLPTNEVARSRALYIVWIGHNDLQAVFHSEDPINTAVYNEYSSQALSNIQYGLETLYSLGGRIFLVPNLGDMTQTPQYISEFDASTLTVIRSEIQDYNSRLAKLLNNFASSHHSCTIFRFDFFSLFDDLVQNHTSYSIPSGYGIGDTDSMFLQTYDWWIGENYVSWDGLHPTSKVHRIIADRLYDLTRTAQFRNSVSAQAEPASRTVGQTVKEVTFSRARTQ
jgi:phospholipase/lecithinase/hemolysin